MATEKRLGGPGSKTRPKMEFARAPSVSLGSEAPQNGQERVTGLDAGMDATLALRAPPGGPDRGTIKVHGEACQEQDCPVRDGALGDCPKCGTVKVSPFMESAAVPEHWSSAGEPLPGNPLLDPGPPPPMPIEPLGVWPFGLSRLTALAQARDADGLAAYSTLRLPPAVSIYKHELLEWVGAIQAYEAANKK